MHWQSNENKLFKLVQVTFENNNEICFTKLLLDYMDFKDGKSHSRLLYFPTLENFFFSTSPLLSKAWKKAESLRPEACNFINIKKRHSGAGVFSYDLCKIFKNTFFTEHLLETASEFNCREVEMIMSWVESFRKTDKQKWMTSILGTGKYAKNWETRVKILIWFLK